MHDAGRKTAEGGCQSSSVSRIAPLRYSEAMRLIGATALLAFVAACSGAREYELRGQVLAVNAERREITVKHEDIRGFMPAMTMAFAVKDEAWLRGREPGETIRATLVVTDRSAHLENIERTGFAPLADAAPPPAPDVLEAGEAVPDAPLTDHTGRARKLSDWRGQVLAVTFIYTRCPLPNFCPLMDRHFAEAQREIARDPALRSRVHLLSVSFDPAFDTPKVLAAHAARVEADPAHWTFVTGEREPIDRLASRFGVSIIREDRPAAEIVHNLRTAVIDRNGRLVTVLSGNEWTPAELIAQVRQAIGR